MKAGLVEIEKGEKLEIIAMGKQLDENGEVTDVAPAHTDK